jgi:hypothetical protein
MLGRLGGNPMSASQRSRRGLISPIIVAAAALSGCSDTTVADHSACKAKAYEVFKVSPDDWNHAYDDADVKFKQCVAVIKSAADLQTCRDARNKALAVPDALDYVRLCMISAGYRETDICIEEAQASGHPRSYSWIGYKASCFERSWWNGWGE